MRSSNLQALLLFSFCLGCIAAPAQGPVDPAHPMITPPPTLVDRTPTPVNRRDFNPGSYLDGSASTIIISSCAPSGYANWTEDGWSLLVHGNVYKQPNISESKLNDLANVFLIGTDIKDLPESQQVQARNLTAEIFVVAEENVNISFTVVPDVAQPSGQAGGLVAARAGSQEIIFPEQTTDQGDFARFIALKNTTGTDGSHLLAGNDTTSIQVFNYYALNATGGNATGYLVPPTGFTVISDIDDILRVTQIYKPAEGLLNSFARPFRPWLNMPAHYAKWASAVPDLHFHYLTTTPEQVTANYMDYIFKTYPLGSFDTRPLNFSDVSATLSIRKFLLQRVFETFPQRKFVLVADTSNSDVMSDYPALVSEFPNQVQCVWLRNTSSTDSDDKFPYNTKGFKDVDPKKYMFFNVPDDLTGLDFANGQCLNSTVKQHVTFDVQGLPFEDAAIGAKAGYTEMCLVALMVVITGLAVS
ncbi:hypothetical protein V490_06614 [Pseudogymnoascus sp. VKM F-3557]|nr:hypothetical protein V490_06614 [Pseudogymnoascus sp. VKM F-3557]